MKRQLQILESYFQNMIIYIRNKFICLGCNISSAVSSVNICISKVCTAIDRILILWKSDLSDKIKQEFFQAVAVLVLLYGCTT